MAKGQGFRPVIQDIQEELVYSEPSLGLLELNSIARGIKVCDEILKQAPIDLIEAAPICTGKYLIIIGGEVDSVKASFERGVELAGHNTIDTLYLAKIDQKVFPALLGIQKREGVESLGIVETVTVASSIVSADIIVKTAEVNLIEVRVAQGLGGKGFVLFSGDLNSVTASLEAAQTYTEEKRLLLRAEVIPSPDSLLVNKILTNG